MARVITAAVLGGAASVWSDLEAARQSVAFDVIVACNSAFRDFQGHVHHAVSFHSDLLPWWAGLRMERGQGPPDKYWTCHGQRPILGAAMGFVPAWGGSSGLIGAQVGMAVADHVVLCGVPLCPSHAHFDRAGEWLDALDYRSAWQDHFPDLRYKVRSMSGWTAELLGMPTEAWLNSV
ncbi:MAG: hypothetical protein WA975_18265 [Mesorhizobium sp.]